MPVGGEEGGAAGGQAQGRHGGEVGGQLGCHARAYGASRWMKSTGKRTMSRQSLF